jgi:catechol 2,3-dioxygenase
MKPAEKHPNPIDPRVDIGHVHLKTADLQKVYDFYVGILGFEVVMRMTTALFISAGGYHYHLAFNTWESEGGSSPPPNSTGLYHVAIRYPDRASLGDALRRLAAANWPLEGVNDHGTHEALYLRDPDDNGLELYYDRPKSEWPLDKDGHLDFTSGRRKMDLESLLKEGT